MTSWVKLLIANHESATTAAASKNFIKLYSKFRWLHCTFVGTVHQQHTASSFLLLLPRCLLELMDALELMFSDVELAVGLRIVVSAAQLVPPVDHGAVVRVEILMVVVMELRVRLPEEHPA